MTPVDPSPYLAVYGVIVFLVPWLIYGSFIIKGLLYARKHGISLFSLDAGPRIRALRQTDPYAAHLHQRSCRWLLIVAVMWFAGFAVLGLTIYLLHERGVV
jgi:hypothetical protein